MAALAGQGKTLILALVVLATAATAVQVYLVILSEHQLDTAVVVVAVVVTAPT